MAERDIYLYDQAGDFMWGCRDSSDAAEDHSTNKVVVIQVPNSLWARFNKSKALARSTTPNITRAEQVFRVSTLEYR